MTTEDLIQKGRIITQSQIDGDFEGYDDGKLFPLYNGQYWIQKNYLYWYHYSYMPRVTIYEYYGEFYLTIDGLDQFVAVEQLTNVKTHIIISDFTGWKGDTIFKMENGEIWKQDSYSYHYNYSYRPKAIIYNNGYGTKMQVNGHSIKVKRVN